MSMICEIYNDFNELTASYSRLHGLEKDGKYTLAGKAKIASNVALFALFFVGHFAVTGTLPPIVAGLTAVGLGVVVLLTQLSSDKSENSYFKIDMASTAYFAGSFVAFGALGAIGTLSGVQMGWLLAGHVAAKVIFDYGFCSY